VSAAPQPFAPEELERYARHIVLREIGGAGQRRLRAARALVVGAGGLGCLGARLSRGGGVGRSASWTTTRWGCRTFSGRSCSASRTSARPRSSARPRALRRLNPHVAVEAHALRLDAANAGLVGDYDLVWTGRTTSPRAIW
jgi:molybdopterin/thiamine biosynthesis adenylyltransferase